MFLHKKHCFLPKKKGLLAEGALAEGFVHRPAPAPTARGTIAPFLIPKMCIVGFGPTIFPPKGAQNPSKSTFFVPKKAPETTPKRPEKPPPDGRSVDPPPAARPSVGRPTANRPLQTARRSPSVGRPATDTNPPRINSQPEHPHQITTNTPKSNHNLNTQFKPQPEHPVRSTTRTPNTHHNRNTQIKSRPEKPIQITIRTPN